MCTIFQNIAFSNGNISAARNNPIVQVKYPEFKLNYLHPIHCIQTSYACRFNRGVTNEWSRACVMNINCYSEYGCMLCSSFQVSTISVSKYFGYNECVIYLQTRVTPLHVWMPVLSTKSISEAIESRIGLRSIAHSSGDNDDPNYLQKEIIGVFI